MKFKGTDNYVATQDLMLAVNAAIALKRPLLVKGEPGTGKTMLAEEVSEALGMPLLQWHIKPTLCCGEVWVGQQIVELHHGHDGDVMRGEVFQPLGCGACAHVLAHNAIQRVDVFEAIGMCGKARIGLKQIRYAHEF